MTYPDGDSFEERFTFEIAGRKLSGTASMRGYGYRRTIVDGTIDGNRLSFRTTGKVRVSFFTVRDVTCVYRGTLERNAIRCRRGRRNRRQPSLYGRRISAEQAKRIATGAHATNAKRNEHQQPV